MLLITFVPALQVSPLFCGSCNGGTMAGWISDERSLLAPRSSLLASFLYPILQLERPHHATPRLILSGRQPGERMELQTSDTSWLHSAQGEDRVKE